MIVVGIKVELSILNLADINCLGGWIGCSYTTGERNSTTM
jgi:hypothetical protein